MVENKNWSESERGTVFHDNQVKASTEKLYYIGTVLLRKARPTHKNSDAHLVHRATLLDGYKFFCRRTFREHISQ